MYSIHLGNEAQAQAVIAQCAAAWQAPAVIGLLGDLGAGKTTFVRHTLHALGVTEHIKSPTYSLLECYDSEQFKIAHLDCYRLSDWEALVLIGFGELLESDYLIFVEWPQILQQKNRILDVLCHFSIQKLSRILTFEPVTERGIKIISILKQVYADLLDEV